MRKIAKQLGIATSTVSNILSSSAIETMPVSMDNLAAQIVPKAFRTVEKAIDAGDSGIAMRYLERTALGEQRSTTINFERDVTLNSLTALLPAQAAQPEPIQAAKNPPVDDSGLSFHTNFSADHTNFSQFSLAELEAEVARRKAQIIEVEPEP